METRSSNGPHAPNPGEEMLIAKRQRQALQQKLWSLERRLEHLTKEEAHQKHKHELQRKASQRRAHIRQLHKDKTDFLLMWRTLKDKELRHDKQKILEARIAQKEKIWESRDHLHHQRKVNHKQTRAVELKGDSLHLRSQSTSEDYIEHSKKISKAQQIANEFSRFREQRRSEAERLHHEKTKLYSSKIDSEKDLIGQMEFRVNELKELEQRLLAEFRLTPRLPRKDPANDYKSARLTPELRIHRED